MTAFGVAQASVDTMASGAAARGGSNPPAAKYLGNTPYSSLVRLTPHPVPLGTNAVGDLLIMQFTTGNGNGVSATAPAGWTQLSNVLTFTRALVCYKIAAAPDNGGTATVTLAGADCYGAAIVHRIQAGTFHLATAPEIATANAADISPDCPNVTPSWGGSGTAIACYVAALNTQTVLSWPYANFQTRVLTSANGDGDNGQAVSCVSTFAGASVNPAAYTQSAGEAWQSWTIVVRPA